VPERTKAEDDKDDGFWSWTHDRTRRRGAQTERARW